MSRVPGAKERGAVRYAHFTKRARAYARPTKPSNSPADAATTAWPSANGVANPTRSNHPESSRSNPPRLGATGAPPVTLRSQEGAPEHGEGRGNCRRDGERGGRFEGALRHDGGVLHDFSGTADEALRGFVVSPILALRDCVQRLYQIPNPVPDIAHDQMPAKRNMNLNHRKAENSQVLTPDPTRHQDSQAFS